MNIPTPRHIRITTPLRASAALIACLLTSSPINAAVHFGNGIKIGEVDTSSAIIWTRLTATPERRADGIPFKADDEKIPDGLTLSDMKDSLIGAPGKIRIRYKSDRADEITTPFQSVDPAKDFTTQFHLKNLQPATTYHITLEAFASHSQEPSTLQGSFTTAPLSDLTAPVRFVTVTCHDFPRRDDGDRGHLIYPAISAIKPDFYVHTGDIEYYDKPGPWAKTPELARFKWNRYFSLQNQRDFLARIPSYHMKDDHDTLVNDCWPGQKYGDITWQQGLAIFNEQFPTGTKPYRTFRWGKNLQIWLIEGRDYRSPNNLPDGPEKSILGAEQKKWLFETMRASDASFRILISPSPIIGPDRKEKNDNLANEGFTHEGDQIRSFLASLPNTFIICGDRHWQYVSQHNPTGLIEFSVGPGSDSHAEGFSMKLRTPEHRFLRIKGGFLSTEVSSVDAKPTIIFRHHDVNGNIVHTETFLSNP